MLLYINKCENSILYQHFQQDLFVVVKLVIVVLSLTATMSVVEGQWFSTTPLPLYCPSRCSSGCGCSVQNNGLSIQFDQGLKGDMSPDMSYIRSLMNDIRSKNRDGPVSNLDVINITGANNFVVEDLLGGNSVPDITLKCCQQHTNSTSAAGRLVFSKRAFLGPDSRCGLTGMNLTISGCNLREWDASPLANCGRLTNLSILESYISTVIYSSK